MPRKVTMSTTAVRPMPTLDLPLTRASRGVEVGGSPSRGPGPPPVPAPVPVPAAVSDPSTQSRWGLLRISGRPSRLLSPCRRMRTRASASHGLTARYRPSPRPRGYVGLGPGWHQGPLSPHAAPGEICVTIPRAGRIAGSPRGRPNPQLIALITAQGRRPVPSTPCAARPPGLAAVGALTAVSCDPAMVFAVVQTNCQDGPGGLLPIPRSPTAAPAWPGALALGSSSWCPEPC